MSDLCAVVSEGNCDEFVLECVGVLGNLSLPDLDFSQILTKYNFLNWIMNNLQLGKFLKYLYSNLTILWFVV